METKIIQTEQKALEIDRKKPLILVTGSFDIVHLGHLEFLEKAKNTAPNSNLLAVLLSDENIKIRKGENRPINNQDMRAKFLQYINVVDYILIWENQWQKLRDFVLKLKPEYFIINEDDPGKLNKQKIVNSYGGKFIEFKKERGISTSTIINKIKTLNK